MERRHDRAGRPGTGGPGTGGPGTGPRGAAAEEVRLRVMPQLSHGIARLAMGGNPEAFGPRRGWTRGCPRLPRAQRRQTVAV